MYTNPTVTDFKNYFVRDFPYGTNIEDNILDQDIQNALDIVALTINSGIMPTQEFYTTCFLYLAAHNMVESIKASTQGTSGIYEWLVASKAVGSISVSSAIPQYILNNPQFSMLTRTTYGARYMELIFPYLVGQMFTVCGRTHA
jgi:hypothetical protein